MTDTRSNELFKFPTHWKRLIAPLLLGPFLFYILTVSVFNMSSILIDLGKVNPSGPEEAVSGGDLFSEKDSLVSSSDRSSNKSVLFSVNSSVKEDIEGIELVSPARKNESFFPLFEEFFEEPMDVDEQGSELKENLWTYRVQPDSPLSPIVSKVRKFKTRGPSVRSVFRLKPATFVSYVNQTEVNCFENVEACNNPNSRTGAASNEFEGSQTVEECKTSNEKFEHCIKKLTVNRAKDSNADVRGILSPINKMNIKFKASNEKVDCTEKLTLNRTQDSSPDKRGILSPINRSIVNSSKKKDVSPLSEVKVTNRQVLKKCTASISTLYKTDIDRPLFRDNGKLDKQGSDFHKIKGLTGKICSPLKGSSGDRSLPQLKCSRFKQKVRSQLAALDLNESLEKPKIELRQQKNEPRQPNIEPRQQKNEPRQPKIEPRQPKIEPRQPKIEPRLPTPKSRPLAPPEKSTAIPGPTTPLKGFRAKIVRNLLTPGKSHLPVMKTQKAVTQSKPTPKTQDYTGIKSPVAKYISKSPGNIVKNVCPAKKSATDELRVEHQATREKQPFVLQPRLYLQSSHKQTMVNTEKEKDMPRMGERQLGALVRTHARVLQYQGRKAGAEMVEKRQIEESFCELPVTDIVGDMSVWLSHDA